jgi:hypothetical protein
MSRARSVADLGNQNVLDLNATDGTLKVGAGVTIENTGEVQFAGIVTAATVQIGAATTLHSTGLDLGAGNINSHNITSTGNLSVDGNMSVGGVLTYEDVTSVDSVGIITAQSDVSISDKIIHTGDTDTAIRFPAANTFTVETGGSERVRINSDGKLILSGTQRTTPFISGDGGMCIEQSYDGNLRALTIRNKDNDATAATSLAFSLNRSGGDYDFISGEIKSVKEQTWTTTDSTIDSAMTFSTTANNALTEKLRITSAGQSTFIKRNNNADDLLFGYGTSTGIYAGIGGFNNFNTNQLCDLTFWTNGSTSSCAPTEKLRITSAGLVGVGVVNPVVGLDVKRATAGTIARFYDTGSNSDALYNGAPILGLSRISNGSVSLDGPLFQVGIDKNSTSTYNIDETLFCVANTGVGVGLVAPRVPLEINATHDTTAGNLTPVLRLSTGNSYTGTNTGSALEFGTTNTSYPTWVKGRIGAVYDNVTSFGGEIVFQTNSGTTADGLTEKMRISTGGEIGTQLKITMRENLIDAFSLDSNGANGYFRIVDEYDTFERLRIHGDGGFSINTTNLSNYAQTDNTRNIDTTSGSVGGNFAFRRDKGTVLIANDANTGWSSMYINKFNYNSGEDNRWINFFLNGVSQDSITWTGSGILYGGSSDYRIKKNVRDFTSGIEKVKQLKVRLYDYIDTERGTDHVGFIAHELQEVVPEAVSGEKDGMRKEEETGEDVMDVQMVEYGKVTPVLTAALQEAIAEIETLKARLDAAGL